MLSGSTRLFGTPSCHPGRRTEIKTNAIHPVGSGHAHVEKRFDRGHTTRGIRPFIYENALLVTATFGWKSVPNGKTDRRNGDG